MAVRTDLFESPDYFQLDELLSEEHLMVRKAVRDYVKKEISPIIEDYAQRAEFPKQIIKQLIEGVDYCHSQNVVHRDIKPDNIMVKIINTIGDEHYIVKLCDFGIATILEEGKQSSTLCGTIDYLAPE
jgi:serine/threonine protein kinase